MAGAQLDGGRERERRHESDNSDLTHAWSVLTWRGESREQRSESRGQRSDLYQGSKTVQINSGISSKTCGKPVNQNRNIPKRVEDGPDKSAP